MQTILKNKWVRYAYALCLVASAVLSVVVAGLNAHGHLTTTDIVLAVFAGISAFQLYVIHPAPPTQEQATEAVTQTYQLVQDLVSALQSQGRGAQPIAAASIPPAESVEGNENV